MSQMKIDQINKLFQCTFCNETYNNPIILPCSNTCCLKDIEQFKHSNVNQIECFFCKEDHMRPSRNFPLVKPLNDLIKLGAHQLDLGETFNLGRDTLNDLETKLNEYESINTHKNEFINGYFNHITENLIEIKNKMLSDIDSHFSSVLDELNRHKSECIKQLESNNGEFSCLKQFDLDQSLFKNKLDNWIKQYDTLRINEKHQNVIVRNAELTRFKLEFKMNKLKDHLIMNKWYEIKLEPFDTGKYLSLEVYDFIIFIDLFIL